MSDFAFNKMETHAEMESDDEEFAADPLELDEAAHSSDSEGEDNFTMEEESYMVEVRNGEIHKMKFEMLGGCEESEENAENEMSKDVLSSTLPDHDDEDEDFNPCLHDTLSDTEIAPEETETEAQFQVDFVDGLHKKTGAPLSQLRIDDGMIIPPLEGDGVMNE